MNTSKLAKKALSSLLKKISLSTVVILLVVQFFVFDVYMPRPDLPTGILFSYWMLPISGLLWSFLSGLKSHADEAATEEQKANNDNCKSMTPEILVL